MSRSVTASTTVVGKFSDTDEMLVEFWRYMRDHAGGRKAPPQEYVTILDVSKDKGGYVVHYQADIPDEPTEPGKLNKTEKSLFSAKPVIPDFKPLDVKPTPTVTQPKPAPIVKAEPTPAPADAETMQLALKDIIITGGNYRKNFNAEKIAELAASMNAVGQINAVTVRPKGEKRYELIAGERRVRAARLSKWAKIRAYVVIADDDRVLDIMAAENFGREDLDPIEAANAVAQAMRITGATQTKIAEKFGKSQPWVAQMLRIAEAPREMQDQIIRCLIMPSTAIELLVWADKPEYEAIWSKVKEELSNDEPVTQRRAREIIAAVTRPAPTVAPEPEPVIEEGDLPACFGTEGNEAQCEDCSDQELCAAQEEYLKRKAAKEAAALPVEQPTPNVETQEDEAEADDAPKPKKQTAVLSGPISYDGEITWDGNNNPVMRRGPGGIEALPLVEAVIAALNLDDDINYGVSVYYQPGGYIKIVRKVA